MAFARTLTTSFFVGIRHDYCERKLQSDGAKSILSNNPAPQINISNSGRGLKSRAFLEESSNVRLDTQQERPANELREAREINLVHNKSVRCLAESRRKTFLPDPFCRESQVQRNLRPLRSAQCFDGLYRRHGWRMFGNLHQPPH